MKRQRQPSWRGANPPLPGRELWLIGPSTRPIQWRFSSMLRGALSPGARRGPTAGDANAAMVYTPAAGVKQAIMDCADAGLRLAVVAAEFVPVHDAMYAVGYAVEGGLV